MKLYQDRNAMIKKSSSSLSPHNKKPPPLSSPYSTVRSIEPVLKFSAEGVDE